MDWRSCLLLMFFTVSAAAVDCGDNLQCVPPSNVICADCLGQPNQKVPNPFDCRSFYICDQTDLAAGGMSFTCPDGEIFDSDINVLDCVPGTTCSSQCDGCLYTCTLRPDFGVASPDDCSVYYECDGNDIGTSHVCPPTAPYFDGTTCQTDIAKCCHCHPYCYPEDVGDTVGDPVDCRKYHYCAAEGIPEHDGECGPNEYFDHDLLACSATAECKTLCKNVIGSDGCIEPYTCQALGYFAKCPTKCWDEYYNCKAISDNYIDAVTCGFDYTFHPDLLACVKPEICS